MLEVRVGGQICLIRLCSSRCLRAHVRTWACVCFRWIVHMSLLLSTTILFLESTLTVALIIVAAQASESQRRRRSRVRYRKGQCGIWRVSHLFRWRLLKPSFWGGGVRTHVPLRWVRRQRRRRSWRISVCRVRQAHDIMACRKNS